MKNRPTNERRKRRRIKAAVDAVLRADGATHRCRIYDISRGGMTLLTGPKVPAIRRFQVHCHSQKGTPVVFEVQERQRRELKQGAHRFLRLGMHIVHANDATQSFFSAIEEGKPMDQAKQALNIEDESKPERPIPTSYAKETPSREFYRLQFQLPVLAKIGKLVYRCRTLDISARGLSILAQPDFPQTNTDFPLVCLEPDGDEIRLKVRETNRCVARENQNELRIGLKAIGGSRAFLHFLEKHNLLRPPNSDCQ